MVLSKHIESKLKGLSITEYKWLEEKKVAHTHISSRQNLFKRNSKIYYRGFQFGDRKVYEGDCILIQMGTSLEESFGVARVLQCFDNGSEKDCMRLVIQWYSCADDIQTKHMKYIPEDIPSIDMDCEVVKNFWAYSNEIDAETVTDICHIVEVPADYNPNLVKRPPGTLGHFYICRFNYVRKKPWLCPLTEEDIITTNIPKNAAMKTPLKDRTTSLNISKSEKILLSNKEREYNQVKSPVVSLEKISPKFIEHVTSPLKKSVKRKLLDCENEPPKRPRHEINVLSSPRSLFSTITSPMNKNLSTPTKNSPIKSSPSKVNVTPLKTSNQGSPFKSGLIGVVPLEEKIKQTATFNALGHKSVLRLEEISSLMANDGDDADELIDVVLKSIDSAQEGVGKPDSTSKYCELTDEQLTPRSKRIIKKSNRYNEGEYESSINKLSKIGTSPGSNSKKAKTPSRSSPKEHKESCSSTLKEETRTTTPKGRPRRSLYIESYNIPTILEEEITGKKTPSRRKKIIDSASKVASGNNSRVTSKGKSLVTRSKKVPCYDEEEDYTSDDDFEDLSSFKSSKRSGKDNLKTTKSRLKTKISSSPKTPKSRSKKILPSPRVPERNTPITKVKTQLENARNQLHVSAVPSYLPCREEEFQQIFSFVEGKLSERCGGCMYVSGVPGTGKTATVREVVKLIREQQQSESLPDFHMLEINAMKLTNPHQLWVQVWEGLMNQKVTADHARALLDKLFSSTQPNQKSVLLLLDELDMLWTKKQDVMYNLFDWSSRIGSKLIVVAIANTMDLPERMMISRVSSRIGLTRMTFQPYNYNQLKEIIESRLKGIEAFDPDAVQFVSRKVAAVSGDARRALDICRRATEIAEKIHSGSLTIKSPMKSPKKRRGFVSMEHVSAAIEQMFASHKVKAIKCCSEMEKYFLRAILAEFLRTGLEEANFKNILIQLESISRFDCKRPPSSSQALSYINRLSALRLILAEDSRLDFQMRVRLNVSSDDVSYALQD